jgi:hypothetical protein
MKPSELDVSMTSLPLTSITSALTLASGDSAVAALSFRGSRAEKVLSSSRLPTWRG